MAAGEARAMPRDLDVVDAGNRVRGTNEAIDDGNISRQWAMERDYIPRHADGVYRLGG